MFGWMIGYLLGKNSVSYHRCPVPYVPPPKLELTPEQWKLIAEHPKELGWMVMAPRWSGHHMVMDSPL